MVPAIWQLGLGGASLFGLLFGGLVAGFGAKKWGRQLFMFVSYSPFIFPSSVTPLANPR